MGKEFFSFSLFQPIVLLDAVLLDYILIEVLLSLNIFNWLYVRSGKS